MPRKINYDNWSKEELIKELRRIKETKYGLVWHRDLPEEKIDTLINPDARTPNEMFPNEMAGKPFPILKEVKGKELNNDKDKRVNLLIEGDNYHSLAVLNFTHQEAIDLIYIDPPYNTGNDDFIYNDKIKSGYVKRDDPFRHSKWLAFMEKRLKLAKNLLKKDGVMFMSIDDNEFAQLKLLADEIFDEKNFIIDVIWNSRKSVSSDAIVSLNHNHTLVYTKDIDFLREVMKKSTKFKLPAQEEKFSNPDNDPRGPWVADPFEAAGVRKNLSYAIKNPNTGEVYYPVKGRHWAVLEQEYFKLLKDNKIVFGKNGKGKPSRKRFLSDAMEKGLTPKSIWDDVGTTTNGTQHLKSLFQNTVFQNPKPESLIERIIQLATNEKDIVVDYHLGSGTTASTAHKMNRQYIGIEQMDYIETVAVERLKKVIEGEQGGISKSVNWQGGGDFVYLELKKYNQTFIEQIEAADDTETLLQIWKQMKAKSFFKYNIDLQAFENSLNEFKQFDLKRQKEILCEILDKNQLYVNLSSLNDADFACTEEEKKITKEFYQIKH